ncbi:MAG: DUF2203 domain-containing protein [Cyanobacteria bacterium P01_D01_bin.14]
MKPVPPSTERPLAAELSQFETALKETAKDFLALRDRYFEVKKAQQQRTELQTQLDSGSLPSAELKQLQQQIDTLEETLEGKILTWEMAKEPFWQALRFGGLGLVVGWLLRGWAG